MLINNKNNDPSKPLWSSDYNDVKAAQQLTNLLNVTIKILYPHYKNVISQWCSEGMPK